MAVIISFLLIFAVIFTGVLVVTGEWDARVEPALRRGARSYLGMGGDAPAPVDSITALTAGDSTQVSFPEEAAAVDSLTVWRSTQEDSLRGLHDQMRDLRQRLGTFEGKLDRATAARDEAEAQAWKTMARLFGSMRPDEASGILELLPEGDAVQLLSSMNPRNSAELMGKIEVNRAARLSSQMTSYLRDVNTREALE